MTAKARLTITIPTELKEQLEKEVPSGKRAQFTVEAIEYALREKARAELLEAMRNIKPVKPIIDSVEVVRQIREERSERYAPKK